MAWRGLTWDHPRGYAALEAASARAGDLIQWDRQPLEGFEAHPIADLCARYDLVVLDHPHVGEAVAAGCLRPIETLFDREWIDELGRATIGPCLASYRYAGQHWALPLDAATQVMAYRADLIDGAPPSSWSDVIANCARAPVTLSLAGPHAALSLWSIAATLGDPPAAADPDHLIGEDTGRAALEIMAEIAARAPLATRDLNPIGILGHMAANDDVALCPLIYGYVNYAAPTKAGVRPIGFADAPRSSPGLPPRSTLGGTGIGISTRCEPSPPLLDHLRWLLSAAAQERFIPAHQGQPSRRSAWHDDGVNGAWGGFYRATAETLENAYVRPRHDGSIAFQTRASALIRDGLSERRAPAAILAALRDAYAASHIPGCER